MIHLPPLSVESRSTLKTIQKIKKFPQPSGFHLVTNLHLIPAEDFLTVKVFERSGFIG
jgi:hypothetical protein